MSLFLPLMLASGAWSDPMPTSPILVMQVAEYVREDGNVLLGPHLMTPREIDEMVDRVIADAEEFRRMAKHELDLATSRSRPR